MLSNSQKIKCKLKFAFTSLLVAIIALIGIVAILPRDVKVEKTVNVYNPELAKSMTYPKVEDGDGSTNSEYVKFDAYFLRDLDGDGIDEKLRGTCKKLNQKDSLYINLSVAGKGVLKEGVITVNSDNFYFQTVITKDEEIAENAVGKNIKEIRLKDIAGNKEKVLTGDITSEYYSSNLVKVIKDDISKYSGINSISLTGKYVEVDETGAEKETPIDSSVNFNVDWYGEVKATMPDSVLRSTMDLQTAIDEENQIFIVEHNIEMREVNHELILKRAYVEGIIPALNEVPATKVEVIGDGITSTYNDGKFTAEKNVTFATSEEGTETEGEKNIIASHAYDGMIGEERYNRFKVRIEYPLDAYYKSTTEAVESDLEVTGWYEAFNIDSEGFDNPYISNKVTKIFKTYVKNAEDEALFRTNYFTLSVGKLKAGSYNRYFVSKQKPLNLYDGISNKGANDTYLVNWYVHTGPEGDTSGMVLKETKDGNEQATDQFVTSDGSFESIDDITTNVGISFVNATSMLGEDGWIKVYNDEDGDEKDTLIASFTKTEWEKYNPDNPYRYGSSVKHIRLETSGTSSNSFMYIYNLKELNDEKIVDTYSEEDFIALRSIKSNLVGYLDGVEYNPYWQYASSYELPYAVADISLAKSSGVNDAFSTQVTEKDVKITIKASGNENLNQLKWKKGTFLVRLPEDIVDLGIKSIETNNNTVNIVSYEQYTENGINYIKIYTEADRATTFDIVITCDITPDPRSISGNKTLELYFYNEGARAYYESALDDYDVNSNMETSDSVGKASENIAFEAPEKVLVNETITNNGGDMLAIAPQIAEIRTTQKTVNVNLEVKNNHISPVSDITILGRVPCKDNKDIAVGAGLGSMFDGTMSNEGIVLPETLQGKATVYYSTNVNATKDISNGENGWTTDLTDLSNVKSYLIVLNGVVLNPQEEYKFTYKLNIPDVENYNDVSYSQHAVYYRLNSDEGVVSEELSVVSNKLGVMVVKPYDLEVIKYQKGKDGKVVPGATYKITEDGKEIGRTSVTDINGTLRLGNLYIGRTYILKEIKSPVQYELNENEIRFSTSEDATGLTATEIGSEAKSIQVVAGEDKVRIEVEDEVKAKLKIVKKEKGTENSAVGVRFELKEVGTEEGKILTTNSRGEAELEGLSVGKEYTLSEVKAEGYYLSEDFNFTVANNGDGTYRLEAKEGINGTVVEENDIPVVTLNLESEKIPRYTLQINKVIRGTDTPLAGAKFKLLKNNETIKQDKSGDDGLITIANLYEYEADRNIDQTYTLKEIAAPEGYALMKDITFKVSRNEEGLLVMDVTGGKIKEQSSEGDVITITVENSAAFKLIKKEEGTEKLLANAKFAIYRIEDGKEEFAVDAKGNIVGEKEVINGREYYVVKTDENGEINANLKEGLYKVIEVEASHEKYDISNNVYYFGIGASVNQNKQETLAVQAISISNSDININAVAKTRDNGYVVIGTYGSKTLDIGEYTLENKSITENETDGFIAKYSLEGKVLWTKSVGGDGADKLTSITVYYNEELQEDEIVVGGQYKSSSVQFGTDTLDGGATVKGFVAKYGETGEEKWAREIGSSVNSVATYYDRNNAKGQVIVGGSFDGSIEVAGETVTTAGSLDGMVVKYDIDGNAVWARNIGGVNDDEINAVATYYNETDGKEEIVVGGYFDGSVTTADANSDGILIKYDEDGNKKWTKFISGTKEDNVTSIATYFDSETSEEKIVVGGYFRSKSIGLGLDTLRNSSSGSSDGMIIQYDINGEVEFAKSIGNSNDDCINSVSIQFDETGVQKDILIGGYFESSLSIGKYSLGNRGEKDGIIAKFNTKGEAVWADSVGGKGYDYINSVIGFDDKNIIAVGNYGSRQMKAGNNILINDNEGKVIFEEYGYGYGSEIDVYKPNGMIIKYDAQELENNPIMVSSDVLVRNDGTVLAW